MKFPFIGRRVIFCPIPIACHWLIFCSCLIPIGTIAGKGYFITRPGGPPIDSVSNAMAASYSRISEKTFKHLSKEYESLNNYVQGRTTRLLQKMQQQETSLEQEVSIRDSVKAKTIFGTIQQKYGQIRSQLQSPPGGNPFPLKEYYSGIDSLQTALRFLSVSNTKFPGFSSDKIKAIQAAATSLLHLQATLQQANNAGTFVAQREQQLKDQLGRLNLTKSLLGVNKAAFYLQQQLAEYKDMLQDRTKLEAAILGKLRDDPRFQAFMQKNSYAAQLFHLPDNYGSVASLPGLQTKAQIQELIGKQISPSSSGAGPATDPSQYLQGKADAAQGQINSLKQKLSLLGRSGGSGDMTMPDFKPNSQRTKTFLQRLTFGFSLQTQPTTPLLPATANMALTMGYKFNGRLTAGVGAGYLLGVGNGISHIALSNQGVNLRSYLEWKAKGNWWLTGGAEYNYMQAFTEWKSLLAPDIWQKSALIGIEKKYRISKNRQANVQLLFDALYNQHSPNSQPVIFRTGLEF